jgi:hypothetical protein
MLAYGRRIELIQIVKWDVIMMVRGAREERESVIIIAKKSEIENKT